MTGTQHRRPDERHGRHLGLVPGRLHAVVVHRAAGAICGTSHANIGGASHGRLRRASRAVPVLRRRRRTRTTCRRRRSTTSASAIRPGRPRPRPSTTSTTCRGSSTRSQNGNMPQVSFLKAPEYEDGHAGYSDPLDEQQFLVNTINADRAVPGLVEHGDRDRLRRLRRLVRPPDGPDHPQSQDATDALNGPGKCGSGTTPPAQNDRCGVGPRTPLLVISP